MGIRRVIGEMTILDNLVEVPNESRGLFSSDPDSVEDLEDRSAALEVEDPYDFAKPATECFRGRDLEIQKLTEYIKGGKSTVIFGLQRIGKTPLSRRSSKISSQNHNSLRRS